MIVSVNAKKGPGMHVYIYSVSVTIYDVAAVIDRDHDIILRFLRRLTEIK